MAKVNIEELIEYLRVAGAEEKDIPTWVMTAYYESNFDSVAQNEDTDALGIFQINADRFYDGDEPDNTLKSWFGGNELTLKEFETELEDPQYNTSFAIHYYNIIKEDIEQDGTSQFPDVAANGNDPFAQWEGYLLYVKPYLEDGELPKGRGENAAAQQEDMIGGINSYVKAFYGAGLDSQEEELVIPKPEVKAPSPQTESKTVTIYNQYNQPEQVSENVAEELVNNTYYTYEPKETNPLKEGGALINKFPDTNRKLSEFDDRLQDKVYGAVDEVKEKASNLFGPARNFYALLKDLTSVGPSEAEAPGKDR
tara:strand:+ start:799 stop:1728 length:930 start_codon:yes stop_codon:yes gene_type:complete